MNASEQQRYDQEALKLVQELNARVKELEGALKLILSVSEHATMGWPEEGAVQTEESQDAMDQARAILLRPKREAAEAARVRDWQQAEAAMAADGWGKRE